MREHTQLWLPSKVLHLCVLFEGFSTLTYYKYIYINIYVYIFNKRRRPGH